MKIQESHCKKEISALNNVLKEKERMILDLENSLRGLYERNQELITNSSEERKKQIEATERKEKEVQKLKSESRALEDKIEEQSRQLARQAKPEVIIKKELSYVTKPASNLTIKVDESVAVLKETKDLAEKAMQATNLKVLNEQIQDENMRLKRELPLLQERMYELEGRVAGQHRMSYEVKEAVSKKRQKTEDLVQDLLQMDREAELKARILALEASNEALQRRCKEREEKTRETESKNGALLSELEEAKARLRKHQQ